MTVEATLTVTSEDGRSLDVAVAGPDDGTLILLHEGTPASSAHLFEPLIKAGAERGLRQATYARILDELIA